MAWSIILLVLGIILLKEYERIKHKPHAMFTFFEKPIEKKKIKIVGIVFLILGGIGVISIVSDISGKSNKPPRANS